MKEMDFAKKTLIVALVFSVLTLATGLIQNVSATTLDASPARIAFNGNGDLLVTDYIYGQVLTVAPDTLDIIDIQNINGSPLGIAWADGLMYVGNSSSGQVEVYNNFGQEVFTLGHGNNLIQTPQDIAIANSNVYVVDGTAKNVKVFSTDGTFEGTIPANGFDQNILANPTAITIDNINQQVFVSDFGDLGKIPAINPRIQVFGFDGALLYTINSGESNKYRFTMPQGLTLNGKDQLYVIDSLTGEIHIFNALNGMLVSKVKGSGIDAGVFAIKMPLDLVIDSVTNDVFVTNNMMASIKVFDGAGGI